MSLLGQEAACPASGVLEPGVGDDGALADPGFEDHPAGAVVPGQDPQVVAGQDWRGEADLDPAEPGRVAVAEGRDQQVGAVAEGAQAVQDRFVEAAEPGRLRVRDLGLLAGRPIIIGG